MYEAIGNLIKDNTPGEERKIEWNVYGKISKIYIGTGTMRASIEYPYDASGNRIEKIMWPTDRGIAKSTIYVRNASGNVMSIYEKNNSNCNSGKLTQTEVHLYGSSRLGVFNMKRDMESDITNPDQLYGFERGNKFFELTNHLGNVLATVSDRKLQVQGQADAT